ncbi:hypothetical protein [Corynebacterium tuberculostearicum]|uniref:Uncharacterized protein n=1 Tax=Corynebacterium tuberculostearicum TaxID=38304 RepID=A0A8I1HTP4_9CORY|nr:hypothetical protein [Corynebacterium tuberculostearicum]MBK3427390.1 hypothetical protein [Corynebacterium tuberculostearicum]
MGDELFLRDIARRQLADALSATAILTQLALFIAVTAAMGIPPPTRSLRPHRRHRGTRNPPRRQPHLLHHTAPSMEHQNGVPVAGGYWVVK